MARNPDKSVPAQALQPGPATVRQELVQIQSGPLPTPQAFEHYERVLAGAADRILLMAERQAENRHRCDMAILRQTERGQWFGFVLGCITLGGGVAAVLLDKSTGGLTALVGGLAALLIAFLAGRRRPTQAQP